MDRFYWEELLERLKDKAAIRVADLLPRRVVTWAYIRVAAEVSTGVFSHREVPALTAIEVLRAWEDTEKPSVTEYTKVIFPVIRKVFPDMVRTRTKEDWN